MALQGRENDLMKYGIILTAGTLDEMIGLAAEAEANGWDGVFYWDAIAISGFSPIYDPWVTMAAFATATERVRLGTIITPPSRRRPWKLAKETATLDHLSHGRLVLPVGLGVMDDQGYRNVGEVTDLRARAEILDESLEILTRAWSGEPFAFEGAHYQVSEMHQQPGSYQQPRIPIWVVGVWPRPKSVARAFRYDGIIPQYAEDQGVISHATPERVRAIAEAARAQRPADAGPFDIITEGVSPADDAAAARAQVAPFAEAGATWWIESRWQGETAETLRARIAAGPPR
ncbi:MAG: LLM class flavin-dependent oxidoreductase [Thermomicrobiales bacterium]|nr:LLM class flavin-dependent oxidoreductase [Thermomicrobiales bacterium]